MASQDEIRKFFDEQLGLERSQKNTYTDAMNYDDEEMVITYLPVNITGTERNKPQIRLFLDKINSGFDLAKLEKKRHFIFSFYDKRLEYLSDLENLNPSEWLLSLEVNERYVNDGRVDIRSMFEYLDDVLRDTPTINFVKCPSNKHNSRDDIQGTFIRIINSQHIPTPDNLKLYLKLYDNRPYILENEIQETDIDSYSHPCTMRTNVIQEIHFGAPGTGKSYSLSKIIGESYSDYEETDDNPFVFRTTVHNEYSYFDFIGSVMPTIGMDNKIEYKFNPGIFTQALNTALSKANFDIYLIIEEMSRGNIASIFGDIFQLLDRDSTGKSEYRINNELIYDALSDEAKARMTKNKIFLPSNFHILGTVNTSDQNVNVIDTAFKRRFGFVYEQVNPKPMKIRQDDGSEIEATNEDGEIIYLNSYTFHLGEQSFEWNKLYKKLNDFIVDRNSGLGLSEDKQLGQFFVKFHDGQDEVNFQSIKNKVLHYLWEDVQLASMTDNKIFNREISSFADLYDIFNEHNDENRIFSEEFITFK